jgi:hypothetical protein
MSTSTNTNTTEPEVELNPELVFADPVSYLRRHGIDAALVSNPVSTLEAPIPVAA